MYIVDQGADGHDADAFSSHVSLSVTGLKTASKNWKGYACAVLGTLIAVQAV